MQGVVLQAVIADDDLRLGVFRQQGSGGFKSFGRYKNRCVTGQLDEGRLVTHLVGRAVVQHLAAIGAASPIAA